jgi:Spy/CpxP family protein refolding chaperone
MKALGSVIAGGLLACMAMIVASGPAAAADSDADAPGAPADGPRAHHWDHERDGQGPHDDWQHHGWQRHGWHHHRGGAAMFRELGLTDAQRTSMKSILEAAKPAMKDLREKLQANFKLLRQTTPDDKNYTQLVAKVSQENGALTAKLISARSKLFSQCYAVLEPVQKTHLAELVAKRAKWMADREEHMKQRMRDFKDGGHGPRHDDPTGGAAPTPPPH